MELVRSFIEGDAESFALLYERYKRPLYSYLNRLVPGQHQLADDIFQQTWIKAVRQMGLFGKEQRFSAWMMRIAHNLLIDHFRKEKHVDKTREIEEFLEYTCDEKMIEPWKEMEMLDLQKALAWAIEELSEDIREVFVLRQDGVSFKEIAEIQGSSINTALGRMQYALKKLRVLLEKWKLKGGER
ncbi:MAG: hypothetical protein A2020_04065 [Lentisphaerae bacterium GWF2_45_14]|nr:MAG: hypothetical protein A2020_04065 [Lentisphaerae bacterium GWF2_45_14]